MFFKKYINHYFIIITIFILFLYRYLTINDSIFTFLSLIICTFSFFFMFDGIKNIYSYLSLLSMYFLYFVFESSYYYGMLYNDSGFTDAFFYHLRSDIIYSGFMINIDSVLVFSFVFLFIAYAFHVRASCLLKKKSSAFALAAFFLGVVIAPSSQSLVASEQVTPMLHAEDQVDLSIFSDLDGGRIQVAARPEKKSNVVLIYAESLDARFFDEEVFPGLLPELKGLRERSINFTNLGQGIGASWTMGGIVASQCGYPLIDAFGIGEGSGANNLNFLSRFMPKAECLGDFFRGEGYRLTYMGGADTRFGGKEKFLRDHGYEEVLGRIELEPALPDRSYLNYWGVYDDTLFEMAFSKYNSLSKAGNPFFLTILTVDTHAPIGFKSKTCSDYKYIDNKILHSYGCTSFLLSDLIGKIRKSPFSENTVIIVVSDHLAMRNTASSLLKTSKHDNNLSFFINYPDQRASVVKNKGLQYDIAPTILEAIGYRLDGQFGLGKSLFSGDGYLVGRFGADGWQKYKAQIMQLAKRQWDSDFFIDDAGIEIDFDKMTLMVGGEIFDLRSEGAAMVPSSIAMIIDKDSLKIEKISIWPYDRDLKEDTISNFFRDNPGKIFFALSDGAAFKYLMVDRGKRGKYYAYGVTGQPAQVRPVESLTKITIAEIRQLQQ